jgi:nucleotidyltransferase/DNA polymerase involved in DNA repair
MTDTNETALNIQVHQAPTADENVPTERPPTFPSPPPTRKSPFGDISPVIDVEGVGPVFAEALKAMGIHDTRDLWQADNAAVATRVNVPVATVSKWQQMAELIAINGVGPQYAELLQRSGIGSIAELKGCDADSLLLRLTQARNLLDVNVQGNIIGHASVAHWIQAAKDHKWM